MKTFQPYRKNLKQISRKLRNSQTFCEQRLWAKIRRGQLGGLLFYRQKPLLDYIVDFYCPKAKLIIELDGGQHYEISHQSYDIQRDQRLAALGFYVMRVDNLRIIRELDNVVEEIYQQVFERVLQ